jgi:iron complex outermembrane receptor protein
LVLDSAPAAQLNAFKSRVAQFGGTSAYNGLSEDINWREDSPMLSDHQVGFSSDLTWDIGDSGYKLRLVDSYRDWHDQQNDGDLAETTLDLFHREAEFRSDSQSHELQFVSPKDALLGGRLSYVAGFYFFQEHYGINTRVDLGSQWCPVIATTCSGPLNDASFDRFSQVETSYAGYIQGDFKILNNLTLTLGGRLTSDEKSGVFGSVDVNPAAVTLGANEQENNLRVSKTQPTYRANLSWNITPSVLAYASYSTGYKSGGFNSAAAYPALNTTTRTFADETSDNYEIGLKSVLMDRRLLLNVDAYQMDIDDFQSRAFNGVTFIIENAGNIRARGIEADGQFQVNDHIKLTAGGDYLSSVYTAYSDAPGLPGCSTKVVNSCVGYENMVGGNPTIQNLTGRPVEYAPKWQGDLAAEYDTSPFAGGYILQVRPDISYQDRFFSTNDDNPNAIVKSHSLVDLRATLVSPSGRWTLTAYGTNLANKLYYTEKYAQTLGAALGGSNTTTGATLLRGYMGDPREFGVKLSAQF